MFKTLTPETLTPREAAAVQPRTSSESIVLSPPNSVTASALTAPCALEETPGCAATFVEADPIRTIDPSSG